MKTNICVNSDFVEKVVTLAKTKLPEKQFAFAAVFIRSFFENISWDDFSTRKPEEFCDVVLAHFELLWQRQSGETKIKIFNSKDGSNNWQCPNTIIQIIHNDMPFLIDSIQMELERLNVVVKSIVHFGGIKVERDAAGQMIAIASARSKEKKLAGEAPIYIEIAQQTNSQKMRDIEINLARILSDVDSTVEDWGLMQQRVKDAIADIESVDAGVNKNEVAETKAFLEWLLDGNFTFLGYRNYEVCANNDKAALHLLSNSSLGVLRDEASGKAYRYYGELPAKAQKAALGKNLLILSKTNTVSTVHRKLYTDSVEVKRFDQKGKIIGVHRFIGLYGSTAFYSSIRHIPILRQKAFAVVDRFGYPRNDYTSKTLMLILESLPRNDFIEADEQELFDIAVGVYRLHGRLLTKLFVREDTYGRYMSCLVYVPRDNYSTELRIQMQNILRKAFNAHEVSFNVLFTESLLARVHFVVRVDAKNPAEYDPRLIEQELIRVSYSWQDALRDQLLKNYGSNEKYNFLVDKYAHAFPASYREAFGANLALDDIKISEDLSNDVKLGINFYKANTDDGKIRLKLFQEDETILLSDALPILENMGFKVVSEYAFKISPKNGKTIWINDFLMAGGHDFAVVNASKENFYEAFKKVWFKEAENDGFNKLIVSAKLNWRETSVLRGLAKYLHQIRFPFSQGAYENALAKNAEITALLVAYFHERFDVGASKKNIENSKIEKAINEKLGAVESLDDDRILRQFLAVLKAVVRTNYHQNKRYISFKIRCAEVPELPLPQPLFEIFVYAPEFEGVHLRMAKVARGGLRFSDRREDFRTEVLGLMKAQQVKNVVIVPNGAKGGFVLKNIPENIDRETLKNMGVECYKNFIRGLLDVTDNIIENKIVPPQNVVRHDEDDPYLVVAADKGTAKFSNTANAISKEYNFWLYDAFASGGSTGYDHKEIGITARGAWESVKYCFAEKGIDTQKEDFTVVGIGDMLGDVFGNGMILSPHIKLVAAFNHAHVFLDPNPDAQATFKERKRIFDLPQSTWEDYNEKLISKGGGVFKRTLKSIPISKEVQKVLDITAANLTPDELIRAILKAPVDLLWNGGIGTYVKAATETHLDVGDRSNDALRIDGRELRARVVSEGGNLGLTQLGRVEYSLNGGTINTDFIDNSGGVDCSDHEVNIKILLNSIMAEGKLPEKKRDELLAKMTDDVADLVLYNNYRQARAISAQVEFSKDNVDFFGKCIRLWEGAGKLNRSLEYLPSDKILEERKLAHIGLTRPEIAIMLAYGKLIMKSDILNSDIPDDPYFFKYLNKLFPERLTKDYAQDLINHRLRREIITTQLTNDLITNMGVTFVQQVKDELNADAIDVIRAYAIAADIFGLDDLLCAIEKLDGVVAPKVQQKMMAQVRNLVGSAVRWFVKNKKSPLNAAALSEYFGDKVAKLQQNIAKLAAHSKLHNDIKLLEKELVDAKVPNAFAVKVANLTVLENALDIVEMSAAFDAELLNVAKIYFALVAGK